LIQPKLDRSRPVERTALECSLPSTTGDAVADKYRYRPALFFLATITVTWIPWAMAVYLQSQPGTAEYAPLFNLVGLLGPFATSLVLILTSKSPELKRDFKDRILDLRRIRPLYLMVALIMPPAVICLSIWLSLPLGESRDQLRLAAGENLLGMVVLTMVLAPVIEEVGWRGYGVDSLRAALGMLKASLLFGVLWSLWHAPLVLIRGTYHHDLASMANPIFLVNFFVGVIPAAVIANWLYYKNGRSIVAGIVLHAMLNGAGVLLNAGQVAKTIATVLYTAIAVAVVVSDRAVFSGGPRNFIGEGSPSAIPS
jgi:CAAX protease family protein